MPGALPDALGRSPELTDLSLQTCHVGDQGMHALARALRRCPKLRRLRLFQPLDGRPGAGLGPPPGLQTFFALLNGEEVDEGAESAAAAAGEDAGSSVAGASSIAPASGATSANNDDPSCVQETAPPPTLQDLDLTHIQLNEAGAAALGRCLLPGGASCTG